jgi:hypothetical protein
MRAAIYLDTDMRGLARIQAGVHEFAWCISQLKRSCTDSIRMQAQERMNTAALLLWKLSLENWHLRDLTYPFAPCRQHA